MRTSHGRVPGSAAPSPRTAARVVAARFTVPTVGLDDPPYFSGGNGNLHMRTQDPIINAQPPPVDGYDDYVHMHTGDRASVPVHVAPTGARIPIGQVPQYYYPIRLDDMENTSPPTQHVLQRLGTD